VSKQIKGKNESKSNSKYLNVSEIFLSNGAKMAQILCNDEDSLIIKFISGHIYKSICF